MEDFNQAFDECPLIAILRGVSPDDDIWVGDVLIKAGFRLIEVPLNTATALSSLERLTTRFGDKALIGAGTILNVEQVRQVRVAGGRLVVSPNLNDGVLAETQRQNMASIPGVFTPSEMIRALELGAAGLKLFPAEALAPAALKAVRVVLPSTAKVFPVGGITPEAMAPWRAAGASGFGLGSALYTPGMSSEVVRDRARTFIAEWRRISECGF